MTHIHLDHCENCGKAADQITVIDGVITCQVCIDKNENTFHSIMSDLRWADNIKKFKRKRSKKR